MIVWLACTILVLLTGIYVLMPLFRKSELSREIEATAETEADRLLDQKTVVYRNLRDLEFEYKMGRLSDSDYRQLGAVYRNEAAGILQKLDKLNVAENSGKVMEKDIGAAKGKRKASKPKLKEDASHCPSCGAEVTPGKKFCGDCGHRLR